MTTKVTAPDVSVLNASPSDASSKRTHINANFSFQTINTSGDTLHTVSAGKTFYLTDLILGVINSNAADSICSIKSDSTIVIPWLTPKTLAAAEQGEHHISHVFKEPIPFAAGAVIAAFSGNASGVVASILICGYEEDDGLKS